LGPCGASEGGV